jgi:hypothetical protein
MSRFSLKNGGYIEKRNGKLFHVRNRKPETPLKIGRDLLGEAFRGPFRTKSQSSQLSTDLNHAYPHPHNKVLQRQQQPVSHLPPSQFLMTQIPADGPEQQIMADSNQQYQTQPPQNQLPNLGPGPDVTLGPHGYGPYPNPGRSRNSRQMALIPIPGASRALDTTGLGGYGYNGYPLPMAHPCGENSYGNALNNPWSSYVTEWGPNAPTIHNFVTTRHICANCGRLRSRKYQSVPARHPFQLSVASVRRKLRLRMRVRMVQMDQMVQGQDRNSER